MAEYFPDPSESAVKSFASIIAEEAFVAAKDECDMRLTLAEGREMAAIVKEARATIAEFLPSNHQDYDVNFLGLVYTLEDAQLVYGDDLAALTNVQFLGISWLPKDGQRRVALAFKTRDEPEGTVFFTIPDSEHVWNMDFVPKLERSTVYSEELAINLQEIGLNAQDMVEDPVFQDASLELRTAMLTGVMRDAYDAMNYALDFQEVSRVECVCTSFYQLFDGQPVHDLSQSFVTQTTRDEEYIIPTGNTWKIIYPEALPYIGKKYEDLKDLSIGGGSPCLSIRDDERGCSYWIPLHDIDSIGWQLQT